MGDDSEQEIRARAYRIWEAEGHPDGQDRRHWELAKQEIAESQGAPGTSSEAEAEADGPPSPDAAAQ